MANAPTDPYAADIVLRDGSTLRLRAAHAADEADLRAFHEGLSPASLYSRFFAVPKTAGPEVARLLRADPVDDVVLVGQTAGRIVAVGTLSRDRRARDRAEVAFAIADAVQGRGVGTRLLEHLAEIARRREIAFFDAFVLADNLAMMRVFEDSGLMLERHVDGEVHRIVLGVAPTARSRDSAAERAVVAATASIAAVVRPASVAVIGANRTRGKIGSELLHNIIAGGYAGRLAVVHPTAAVIDGVTAYRSVQDIPGAVDLAVIAVPAAQVLDVMDACIAKGVKAAVVISAGFSEVGGEGGAREAALLQRVREAGIRLVGPNCMGIINTDPAVRLNATFAPIAPRAGHVALSTQSGALGFAILDYARQLNIGFSTFVSVGNKADVSGNDLVQYWARDPETDVILLYLESFGNPRKFSQIARRVSRAKPIAAVKAGRSTAGSRAAASHTGALAASDAIVDALFRQTGVIRTDTLEELFDVAALLANQPIPRGRRVAILTNAGGPGILAADTCEARGLQLPALGDDTVAALRRLLPATAAVNNPVDMIASATAAQYEGALTALLDDDRIDGVLAIFIPPLVTTAEDAAGAIQRAANARPGKPVLAVCMSTAPTPSTLTTVPNYRFPESAAIALARAAAYGEWRLRPEGTIPTFLDLDRPTARRIVHQQLDRGGGWLPPGEAEALLRAVGLPVAQSGVAATEHAARAEAERIGFPVALKAVGPDILHKADIGGLALDLRSADAVGEAWRDLHDRLGSRLTGVLVQQMVQGGVEMLVGVIDDPAFGHVIACATGGTLTEILADRQLALHPLTDLDARDLVAGLRGVALLRGYRGSAPADEPALIAALLRLSALVDFCPEIRELDINPLVVLSSGACALDVRIRIEPPRPAAPTRRVSYG